MTKADIKTILRLSDTGKPVAEIAEAMGLTPGRVYALLREHRPDRPRTPRGRTSDKRAAIRGLLMNGRGPLEIAREFGVTRQYVYRISIEERKSEKRIAIRGLYGLKIPPLRIAQLLSVSRAEVKRVLSEAA